MTYPRQRDGVVAGMWIHELPELSEPSRLATTMPATNDATPSPTRAMVRTLPDNNSPAPTSTAAVMCSIAVGFTPTHGHGSTKTSRTTRRSVIMLTRGAPSGSKALSGHDVLLIGLRLADNGIEWITRPFLSDSIRHSQPTGPQIRRD